MHTIQRNYSTGSLFLGFFCTCALQLQAAQSPQAANPPQSQRPPAKEAPVAQSNPTATSQQVRPQPHFQARPQTTVKTSTPVQPTPSPQAAMRHGQTSSHFQQVNQLANPTHQRENGAASHAVARFFVKWIAFYGISVIIVSCFEFVACKLDVWYDILGVAAVGQLMFMLFYYLAYYLGEGVNYLIFGSTPAQAQSTQAP